MSMSHNKLPTPVWGELNEVYEPREDTFLLLDTLEEQLDWLTGQKPRFLLEIGSGSGVIITAISKALGGTSYCLAVDINIKACLATQQTAELNFSKNVDVMCGDLVTGLSLRNQVDLIIFNPPYVVTELQEVGGVLARSWAGGPGGTQVLQRLLPALPQILSNSGFGYFVLIEENDPENIKKKLHKIGIYSEIIAKKKILGEKLYIMKFCHYSAVSK